MRSETATLVDLTIPFAAAVKGGDVANAKRLNAVARVHYGPIEPIVESLPALGDRARSLMDEVAKATSRARRSATRTPISSTSRATRMA